MNSRSPQAAKAEASGLSGELNESERRLVILAAGHTLE